MRTPLGHKKKEFVAPNGKELQYPSAPAYYMIKITFHIDAQLGLMSSWHQYLNSSFYTSRLSVVAVCMPHSCLQSVGFFLCIYSSSL